jgi:hypothetical protein
MSDYQTIEVKRGDTFSLDCQVFEADGVTPTDITAWTIRSQVRTTAGALLTSLTAAITTAADGEYTLTALPVDTAAWPRAARMDIEYTDSGGVVLSTETLALDVVRDITR